eukprot:TRINITY_DN2534_c0_g1_i1.p1 TRINITY_DN2534_c0_g1~~TRINITY_DN2534_c0_g1_i1.p1  ORF type:complete len:396 (-),score=34.85 TRINITY_DN2534_c0_g1_i1:50-1237(-)
MAIVNWWGFLIFFAAIAILVLIAILLERKSKSDSILELRPARVITNIILVQICFEIIYPLVIFSLDLIWFEPFHPSQVWTWKENMFFTQRGLITFFGSIIAFTSLFLPLTGIVQNSKNMPDYIFTVFFWHFIIVCFVGWGFPSNVAWWVSCAIGFILSVISSEFVCNKLELMSYESALGGRSKSEELEESKLNSGKSISMSPIHAPYDHTVHHRNNYNVNRSYTDDITTISHIKPSPKNGRRSRESPKIPRRAGSRGSSLRGDPRDSEHLERRSSRHSARHSSKSHQSPRTNRKYGDSSSSQRGSNDGRRPRKSYSSESVNSHSHRQRSSDENDRSKRERKAKRRSKSENDDMSSDQDSSSSSDNVSSNSSSRQNRLPPRSRESRQKSKPDDTKV